MNKKQKTELRMTLAKREGIWSDKIKVMVPYYGGRPQWHGEYRTTRLDELPTYDNATDLLRVVRLLDDDEVMEYHKHLVHVLGHPSKYIYQWTIYLATDEQIAEALYLVLKGE